MSHDGCDHLSDATLVTQFEALAIAPGEFRHREHLRLGFAMLAGVDFGEGALRFRRALRAFATANGAGAKLHETLTWVYLALIAERMDGGGYASSLELLADQRDLLDHRTVLARYYEPSTILASPIARRVFVLPTRP